MGLNRVKYFRRYISSSALFDHTEEAYKGRQRNPRHYMIYHQDGPYLERWKLLPENRWFNVYLHKWHDSDDYTHGLHNHPYHAIGITLRGKLREWRAKPTSGWGLMGLSMNRSPIRFYRRNWTFHGIDRLTDNAWSLFICFMGSKDHEWGFIRLWDAHKRIMEDVRNG